jgi:hypothetical protein
MIKVVALALLLVGPAYAADGNREVRIVNADQAKACTAVGTVKDTRASGRHPDDATQKALSTAMGMAAKSGANAAVISDAPAEQNRETIVLQTYHCGDGVGVSPTN